MYRSCWPLLHITLNCVPDSRELDLLHVNARPSEIFTKPSDRQGWNNRRSSDNAGPAGLGIWLVKNSRLTGHWSSFNNIEINFLSFPAVFSIISMHLAFEELWSKMIHIVNKNSRNSLVDNWRIEMFRFRVKNMHVPLIFPYLPGRR